MSIAADSSALHKAKIIGVAGKLIEACLRDFLDRRPLPVNLRDAMSYAVFGEGKRIRPALVIKSCEAVGGDAEKGVVAGAAIEMVHAFSLVHDDLPALDNDDTRRGRATLHRHTSEAMAILAGDGLLSLAFELLIGCSDDEGLSVRLCRELTKATGDMVVGQVCDTIQGSDESVGGLERLEMIHRNKTGALIRAACRMGGMCGGASDEQLARLTEYGQAIGLMYQVVDDLLDVTGSTEELGKKAGKDVEQNKLTYPAALGIEGSRRQVEELKKQACAALVGFGDKGRALSELCEFFAVRSK